MKESAALNHTTVAEVVNEVLAVRIKRDAELVRIARERQAQGGKSIPLAEALRRAGLGDLVSG